MQTQLIEQLNGFLDGFMHVLPTILKALAVLFIGLWIVKRIDRAVKKYFDKKDFDVSLEGFIRSLVNVGLKLMVFITVASMIGLPSTSLVAVFGAAGLAIGLALQGSLSNFAGGVLILIFKPFKIGDIITAQGETGVVIGIQIFNTLLLTPENKTVILPNGAVSNGTIINNSRHGNLRVDLKVTIDFKEDVNKVRKLILDILMNDAKVLKDPSPSVNVLDYGESSIILAVRPFATPADYWDVYFNSYEKIRASLIENGIKPPQIKRMVVQG
jgi:small conductance mechanosensitive channel